MLDVGFRSVGWLHVRAAPYHHCPSTTPLSFRPTEFGISGLKPPAGTLGVQEPIFSHNSPCVSRVRVRNVISQHPPSHSRLRVRRGIYPQPPFPPRFASAISPDLDDSNEERGVEICFCELQSQYWRPPPLNNHLFCNRSEPLINADVDGVNATLADSTTFNGSTLFVHPPYCVPSSVAEPNHYGNRLYCPSLLTLWRAST